jgi:thioredoxin 1
MPCLMMAPVIDEMSEIFKGKIKFGKVNIDDNQNIAEKFGVNSIPNFVVFKDGKKVGQFVGGMSSEDMEERLRGFL